MKILSSLVVSALLIGASSDCFSQACNRGSFGYDVKKNIVRFHITSDVASEVMNSEVKGVNIRSFRPVFYSIKGEICGTEYGKDDHHVFYQGEAVVGADPKTFKYINTSYVEDKNAVYYEGRRITNHVQQFFVLIDRYATDGDNFFYDDKIMTGSGFEINPKDHSYARTDTKVYHHGVEVVGADPNSFCPERFIAAGRLARDKYHVFLEDKIVHNADPLSFTLLVEQGIFKDKRAVYIWYEELPNIDSGSARGSEYGLYLLDDAGVYRIEQSQSRHDGSVTLLPKRDPATFHQLAYPWTKDKNSVYYEDKPFPDADSETFRTRGSYVGEDRNYRYDHEKKICKFRGEDAALLAICEQ